MKIIYKTDDGIAVIIPTGEMSIEDVALKDVPAGLPYLIIEDKDMPSDRTARNAWIADFSKPSGYGIGADAWHAQRSKA